MGIGWYDIKDRSWFRWKKSKFSKLTNWSLQILHFWYDASTDNIFSGLEGHPTIRCREIEWIVIQKIWWSREGTIRVGNFTGIGKRPKSGLANSDWRRIQRCKEWLFPDILYIVRTVMKSSTIATHIVFLVVNKYFGLWWKQILMILRGVPLRWVILQESVSGPSQDLQIPTGEKSKNARSDFLQTYFISV